MRRGIRSQIVAFAALWSCAMFASVCNASALPFAVDGNKLPTLADVVEKIEHSIVNISTATRRDHQSGNSALDQFRDQLRDYFEGDEFFNRHFEFRTPDRPRRRRAVNLGSGVIIDAKQGHILTNNHLLTDSTEVEITLLDGRSAIAEIIGTDPDMDLALLKVDLSNLVEIELGNSDELRVGDFVLALGNNYGLSSTVTSGIVSALGRSGLGIEQYEEYIQTDAAINPGSSGGALVNLRGEVVGINTAILSPAGGNVGIAFAIPINTAASVANQLIQYGRVKRGVLGVHFQPLTQEMAEAFQLDRIEGVLINKVLPGSAAEYAGMKEGDILIGVNGVKVTDGSQLRTIIALIRVGEAVNVEYIRNGEVLFGSGWIGDNSQKTIAGVDLSRRLEGVVFQNTPSSESGVLVASVERDSRGWRAGIREGDVVVEVNQQSVADVDDFSYAIDDPDELIVLRINRQDEFYFLAPQ